VPDSVVGTIQACGLNWEVKTEEVFLKDGRKVPDRRAVLRHEEGDDRGIIIGTAGKLFTPIQNTAAFATMQPAIDEFGAQVQTAGALGNGDRVWMLLSLPQKKKSEVMKGDEIKPYFLVSNAHTSEKSQSLQARFTSIRVWCENSLNAAMRESRAAVSIPHHKNSADRLKEIEGVVKQMYVAHEESIRLYQAMQQKVISIEDAYAYVQQVYKLRDKNEDKKMTAQLSRAGAAEHEGRLSKVFDAREQTIWLLSNGRGMDKTGRTVWGAYNAVTEYIDHVSILKKGGGLTKNGFETAVFGYGAYQKSKALDTAVEMFMEKAA
jgi:phage/plasmid-like protein (TIGR03299 family)